MFLKDPDAALDYRMDWRALLADGIEIARSNWSVWPAGQLTVAQHGIEAASTTCRLEGGRAGSLYSVTNLVGLSDGSADARALVVRVEHS